MKLTYFDGEVRAELIRLILVQGGVSFEDFRFNFPDWPKVKAEGNFPFGQVPVLEFDGHKLGQSRAIARYAARITGLAGKTSEEQAKADMFADTFEDDILESFWKVMYFEKDPAKKEEGTNNLKDKIKLVLEGVDRLSQQNEGDYLLGNSLTYADLAFYRMMKTVSNLVSENAASDRLQALYQRVASLPKIAEWEKTKPKPAH